MNKKYVGCIVVFLSVGTAISGLVSCVTNSETGRKQAIVFSDSQMNSLGEQAYQEVKQKEKISGDKRLTEIVERVGRRIAEASGAKFNWEFTYLDAPTTVNAFCLPGGKVAVYSGIIPVAKTEASLAAVLGHEVAHAVARHGAERMTQAAGAQAVLVLAELLSGDSKYRGLIMGVMGIGMQGAVLLPFSRKHESEADYMGLRYMAKAGYDPEEAVGLWERMAKLGGTPPEIISTHPDPAHRAAALRNDMPEAKDLWNKSQKQPPVNL